MTLSIIVAMDENQTIGKDNELIWHIPEDLKHFKRETLNHKVIMGRKTFESLGKPLAKRTNVVLTRDCQWLQPGVIRSHSVEECLDWMEDILELQNKNEEFFVIGGKEIYEAFYPYADRLYVTHILHDFGEGVKWDTVKWNEWQPVLTDGVSKSEENPYEYMITVYERKEKEQQLWESTKNSVKNSLKHLEMPKRHYKRKKQQS